METKIHAGTNILITGAGQGIGRAYARYLARQGAAVIIADINESPGQSVASEIRELGGQAEFHLVDVADSKSCSALSGFVVEKYKALHGLVNNAAIFSSIEMKPFWEITQSEWDTLMAVNLRGPFMLTSALLPALKAAGKASIVNVSSDSAWLGRPGYLHYTTSKAGIVGMTNSMSKELGKFGIRVNAISPGPVYTEIPRGTVTQEQKAALHAAQAISRDATPDDMVGVVSFLLSSNSQFVTGQTISVNGGLVHR